MPSRYSLTLPPPPPVTVALPSQPPNYRHRPHHFRHLLLPILAATLTFTFLCIILLTIFLYRKLSRNRTTPSEHHLHHQVHRFSYSLICRATGSFSSSNRLGHGGFGSVYKATIPSSDDHRSVAVKLMDSPGSLQGEREFYNELSISSNLKSPHIVNLIGFSSNRRGNKLLLVYELMENRSLQDSLLDLKCIELMEWKMRFAIAMDVARGLQYLHHSCDPPVIHGDVKPSNILLDCDFRAKIADFGLARVKSEDLEVDLDNEVVMKEIGENHDSPESEVVVVNRSPESFGGIVMDVETASPEVGSFSEGCCDEITGRRRGASGRDWWWKQDNVDGSESGRVKDYVMEWIGNEIKKETPIERISSQTLAEKDPKKQRKNRKPREWWKEEFCEELSKKTKRKKKKKTSLNLSFAGEMWWQKDWGFDGLSGELKNAGRHSHDWTPTSEIPKSGGVSSTPSMRGTVCYIAPEYSGGGILSEKCDIYSFGVLLLVIVSGRRPLQVTASPMSEFERANLISWARQLAHSGKLMELVDPSIHSLNKEQALLCITIALLCLRRSPSKRPSMDEIVGMLSGQSEPPHLPFEFSPSPPSNFPFKRWKKSR